MREVQSILKAKEPPLGASPAAQWCSWQDVVHRECSSLLMKMWDLKRTLFLHPKNTTIVKKQIDSHHFGTSLCFHLQEISKAQLPEDVAILRLMPQIGTRGFKVELVASTVQPVLYAGNVTMSK